MSSKEDVRRALDRLRDSEQAALSVILASNGYAYDDLFFGSDAIMSLELFLQEYPKMEALSMFPNLRSLKLIDQSIQQIEGLESCPELEQLWLMESKISKIQGLDHLTGLQELYLYSNQLTAIEGISKLTSLTCLWLSDNYLISIEGLSALTNLQELNLARNDISFIGPHLDHNTKLQRLNLADNKISNFRDMQPLQHLPKLVDLCLADPFWGECPVASLCNYQTYTLYLLPSLTSLDTLVLADQTKRAAVMTFTKKQLYYNMKERTLNRHVADLMRQARAGLQVCQGNWEQLSLLLRKQRSALKRDILDLGLKGHAQESDTLQDKVLHLEAALQGISLHQAQLTSAFASDARQAELLARSCAARLQLELESAGSIRMEEGQPGDGWYSSCVNLIRTRMLKEAESGARYGIRDIKVLGVTRIHNRHLRIQFERGIKQVDDQACRQGGADGSVWRPDQSREGLDYLFVGEHPALSGLAHVAEYGFHGDAQKHPIQSSCQPVICHNTVNLADAARLAAVAPRAEEGNKGAAAAVGQLLIVKAYLAGGHPVASSSCSKGSSTGNLIDYGRGLMQQAASWQQEYPGATAVYQIASGGHTLGTGAEKHQQQHEQGIARAGHDAKGNQENYLQHGQRTWCIFDPCLVLPEYLVTFEYELGPTSQLQHNHVVAAFPQAAAAVLDKLPDPLLRPTVLPLLPWLGVAAGQRVQLRSGHVEQQEWRGLLEQAPLPKQRPNLYIASEEMLRKHVVPADTQLSSLTKLSLHDCGLCKLEGLPYLPNLTSLDASFNQLTRLDGLGSSSRSRGSSGSSSNHGSDAADVARAWVKLAVLDVSHNSIPTLQGSCLAGLRGLTALDLSFNALASPGELVSLTCQAPQLQQLDLRSNPVAHEKIYQQQLWSGLAHLAELDGQQRNAVSSVAGTLALPVLKDGVTLWHSGAGPTSRGPVLSQHADWRPMVHSLSLANMQLSEAHILSGCRQLVAAHLEGNLLVKLGGLQAAGNMLAELHLTDNLISDVLILSQLTALKRLGLGSNQLTSISCLSVLTGLSQLSVESNQLHSLRGVERLTALMELYAANNRLEDIKEANRLRSLTSLIILDLAGNPFMSSASEDPRLWLLYSLRRLKVLDGQPVEQQEQIAAKAKYSGRLTLSFLEEQLGSSSLCQIRSLDLSSLRIRDTGSVFTPGSIFQQLQELTLNDNQLLSLAPLAGLTSLLLLRANDNRLGAAEPAAQALNSILLCQGPAGPCNAPATGSSLYGAAAAGGVGVGEGGLGVVTAGTSGIVGAQGFINSTGNYGQQLQIQDEREQQHQLPLQRELVMLPSLEVLQINGNGLSSLVPLQLRCLTGLRTLHAAGNELSRLEGLEGLGCLRELVLARNKIRTFDFEALSTLTQLTEINLEDNNLRFVGMIPPPPPHLAPAAAGTASTTAGAGANFLPPTLVGLSPATAAALGKLFPSALGEAAAAGGGGCHGSGSTVASPSAEGVSSWLLVLKLAGNRLSDVGDLERLAALSALEDLTLAGNPLSKKQMFRQLVMSKVPQLLTLDCQPITDSDRNSASQMYLATAGAAAPTGLGVSALGAAAGDPAVILNPLDYTAGLLVSPGVLERGSGSGAGSSGGGYFSGFGIGIGAAGGKVATQGKLSSLVPAVLNYDALSSQLLANATLQPGPTGYPLAGLGGSVPSIQSGTLVLSGANAFGLEGTSIGGVGSISQGGLAGGQRPYSGMGPAYKRRGSLVGVGALSGKVASGSTNGRARAGKKGSSNWI